MRRPLRIAIIGCEPAHQEPLEYKAKFYSARELVARKVLELGREKRLLVEPRTYWPASPDISDLPKRNTFDAAIIPGSRTNIDDESYEKNEWMQRLVDWVRDTYAQENKPMLGICFGHQTIGRAFGVAIIKNPVIPSLQVGFVKVQLTKDGQKDRLFKGVPFEFDALCSHSWSIATAPGAGVMLAQTDSRIIHSYRIGDRIWGVQFHPDVSVENVMEIVRSREAILAREGVDAKALHNYLYQRKEEDRKDELVLGNFLVILKEYYGL